ncbi:hypothetical protein F4861DRAFT_379077 [Xylaria intraflava]|nr:hypothetical protein F4861DRAFT_379077 [Xylaria intraflava]
MSSENIPCTCQKPQPKRARTIKSVLRVVLTGNASRDTTATEDCPVCTTTTSRPSIETTSGLFPELTPSESKGSARNSATIVDDDVDSSEAKDSASSTSGSKDEKEKDEKEDGEDDKEKDGEDEDEDEEMSPGEIRVRTQIGKYIWGDDDRERTEEEEILVSRIYAMLRLEGSPVLVFLRWRSVEGAPEFVRGGLDEIIAVQVRGGSGSPA